MRKFIYSVSTDDIDTFDDIRFDVKWDKLMELQENIENIVGFLLGLIAFAIVVFTTLVTACDILYLTFPPFQQFAHKMNWDGTIDEKKIRLISPEARDANIEAATRTTGQSVIAIYMRKRFKMLTIATSVLVIILVGHNIVINFIVNLVVGFLKAFWLY